LSVKRCYYDDAYTVSFSAKALERLRFDGQPAVVLETTYFYPTSGGQPHDTGKINDVAVIDVIERSSDNAVIHVLAENNIGQELTCEIDWIRRFDHMQQHTGQHILSRAFLDSIGTETVSFHLGADACTIDLSQNALSGELLNEVETLANGVIWENRPVLVQFAGQEKLPDLSMRSEPGAGRQEIRLINIQDFDVTGCGGTHVARTGEIGLIKIIRTENFRGGTRVTFKCGSRALDDYRSKNALVNQLSVEFTTSAVNIPSSIDKLQSDLKSQRHKTKKLQKRLATLQAQEFYNNGTKIGPVTIVSENLSDCPPGELSLLAALVASNPKTIALFGCSEPRLQFVFCRSEDSPGKMNDLLSGILEGFDSAGGGGSEIVAQGGGAKVASHQVTEALAFAKEAVIEQIR
jgi:alanyl-tRNA synthetase